MSITRRNRYTQQWVESSSSLIASSDAEVGSDDNQQGLAAQLYSSCQSALRDVCSHESGPETSSRSFVLKEELTKLYLWGQSLGAGELDTALEYSDDARYLVLDTLGNTGRVLLRGEL